MSKNNIKKFVKRHIIFIIAAFMFANSSIIYLLFSKAQNANCMYQSQIDSDSRCLYIYHNEVYEKGTKGRPHQGVDCGINVDSIIPSLHFSGSIAGRFSDAKIGTYCAGLPPTQTPTAAPTEVPQQPTEAPAVTQVPTATATPKKTSTPVTAPTTQSTSVATPAPSITNVLQTSEPISGNSFGEILGKPKNDDVTATLAPINTKASQVVKVENFNLTKISKPLTYVSFVSFIGSLILIFLF